MIDENGIVIILLLVLMYTLSIKRENYNVNNEEISYFHVPTIKAVYLDKNYIESGESLFKSFDLHKGIGIVSDNGEYIMLLQQNMLVVYPRFGRSWRVFMKFGLKNPQTFVHRFFMSENGGFKLYDVHNKEVEHDGTLRIFDDRGFMRYACHRNQNIKEIKLSDDGHIIIDGTPVIQVKRSNNVYGNRPLPYVNMNYFKQLF